MSHTRRYTYAASAKSPDDPNLLLGFLGLAVLAAIVLAAQLGAPPLLDHWPSWAELQRLPATWQAGEQLQWQSRDVWLAAAWLGWVLVTSILGLRLLVTVALGRGDLYLAHTPGGLAWAAARRVLAALVFGFLVGLPELPPHLPSLQQLSVALRGGEIPTGELVAAAVLAAWIAWLWSTGLVVVRGVALAFDVVRSTRRPRPRTAAAIDADASALSWWGLAWLLVWLAAALWVLLQLVGLPHVPRLPAERPTWGALLGLLRNPLPPVDVIVEIIGALAWLGWLYLASSLLFRLLVAMTVLVSRGATWSWTLCVLSDRISIPLVRRAVSFAFLVSLVVRAPTAGAEPAPAASVSALVAPAPAPLEWRALVAQPAVPTAPVERDMSDDETVVHHTVVRGETLSSIARDHFGNSDDYPYLIEANRGRRMPDGRIFQDTRIYPDWDLLVQMPSRAVEVVDGRRFYVVQPGDTLWGIAGRFLGDWQRWREVFQLNEQRARMPDGRTLTNPHLIWPGLRIELPPTETPAAPAEQPTDEASAEPATAAPSPAASATPAMSPSPVPPAIETTPVPTAVVLIAAEPTPPAATSLATPVEQDEGATRTATMSIMPTEAPAPAAVEPVAFPPGLPLLWPPPDWAIPTVGVAVGTALLVAGAGLGRRRPAPPRFESDTAIRHGFAEASGDEAVYEERARALAEQVLAFAHEHGCPSLQLVGAYAGHSGATLLLNVPPAEAQPLAEVAKAFGPTEQVVRLRQWDARSSARLLPGDWRWEQAWATVRPRVVPDGGEPPRVELLPLGLAANRRILYADRAAIGLLIAGHDTADVHELQTAFVVDLARRQPPDELHLLTIARPERLSPVLQELPQQQVGFVDPADGAAVADVFARVAHELDRRLEAAEASCGPDLVVVVDEWAELPELGAVLDVLAQHGPGVGIRLLAATTHVDDANLERWVGLFDTRLVLQVADETASVRLVGEPRAEDLDRGGELWPYLHGRLLPPIRGFRVPPPHVQQLIEQMQAQVAPVMDENAPAASAPGEPSEPVDEAPAPPMTDPVSVNGASSAPKTVAEPASSVEAGRQLPLIRFVRLPEQSRVSGSPRVHVQVLAGHAALVDGETVPEPRYRFPWQLFALVASLPPGEAVRLRVMELLWPAAFERDDGDDVDEDKLDKRLRANLFNLKKVWRAYLPEEEVERLWDADGGVIYLNDVLVTVDLHAFLQAAQDGDRARAANPPRLADAIAAYRRALGLYTGPLLAGRDEEYPWVPELRERYQRRQREVTHRLAELLMDAGQVADAAPLWADLMRDPGPPDPERDRHDPYAYREQCARAVFACCRQLWDVGLLVRTHQELVAILRALYADAEVAEAAEPEALTTALFKKIYGELTESDGPAVNTAAGG